MPVPDYLTQFFDERTMHNESQHSTTHDVPSRRDFLSAVGLGALAAPLGQQPRELLPEEGRVLESRAALAKGLAELLSEGLFWRGGVFWGGERRGFFLGGGGRRSGG